MGCPEQAMPVPAIMFVLGVLILTIIVARREKLGLKDALLVLIGMRRYDHPPFVVALMIVVAAAPFGTWLALYRVCSGSLLPT